MRKVLLTLVVSASVLSCLWGPGAAGAQDTLSQAQVQDLATGAVCTHEEFFRRVSAIGEFLGEFVDSSAVPGISLALGIGGFTWFQGFGYADLGERRPMTPHSRLRIGSVSKSLTAMAMGRLLEEGLLDLDLPVWHYVPEFPVKEHPLTSRHILGHQSGIRHYRGTEAYSNERYATVTEAMSVFADEPLLFEPGTSVSYSTYGFTLLSAVMEKASGRPFLSLVEDLVLDPVGMTRTGPEIGGEPIPEQATGYELGRNGQPYVPPQVDLSNKWAGGGYVSTAGDLLKFARAHLAETVLRTETVELLWTPQATAQGTATTHAMGWQVVPGPGGRTMLVSGGSAIGGTAVVFLFPGEEVIVVFLTNMGNAPIRGVPMRVAQMLLGEGEI